MEVILDLPQEFLDRFETCLNHPDAWDDFELHKFISEAVEKYLIDYESELDKRLWFFTEKKLETN